MLEKNIREPRLAGRGQLLYEGAMDSFLKELAQPQPDPGGGAAAAYGARVGLALLEKVVLLEGRRRRKPAGASTPAWEEARTRLRRLAENFENLLTEDVRAYFNLTAARASGDAAQLAAAVRQAVDCPRQMMVQASESLELLAWSGARCKKHLVSDLLVVSELLGAAQRGAAHIAAANLPLMAGKDHRQALAAELRQACQQGEDLYLRVRAALAARGGGLDHCRG